MAGSESDDYSTDERNKKRKALKETKGDTERSKKMIGTSPNVPKNEDKLDKIIIMIEAMNKDQKEMKAEQREIARQIQQIGEEQKHINEELTKLKTENENLKRVNLEIKKENEINKKEITDIKREIERTEKISRKRNVVMYGIKLSANDRTLLKNHITEFIKQNLNLDIIPKEVTKIGERTCLIEFENEIQKNEIMQNKKKLKDYKSDRIFINDDLTHREREKQKQIRKFARSEIEKGSEVKIGYSKVNINGVEWRWNETSEKMEKIKKAKN